MPITRDAIRRAQMSLVVRTVDSMQHESYLCPVRTVTVGWTEAAVGWTDVIHQLYQRYLPSRFKPRNRCPLDGLARMVVPLEFITLACDTKRFGSGSVEKEKRWLHILKVYSHLHTYTV
jgi:hypothetical protein